MITRAKLNNTKPSWKPSATSTPLKLISDQTETDGLPQKQFTKGKDAKILLLKKTIKTVNKEKIKQIPEQNGQIAKKFRRNRSNFYFNVPSSSSSSSSEDYESCLSSNGPTIKINLEGSTNMKSTLKRKIFVSPKSSNNESKKILVENGVNVKSGNKRSFSKKDSLKKEIRVNGEATKNGKFNDKVISASQKLDYETNLSCRSENSDYDYEDNHKENSLRGKKNISQNKGNNNAKFSKKLQGEIIGLKGSEPIGFTESSILDVALKKECGKSSQQCKVNLKSKKIVHIKSQNSSMLHCDDVPYECKGTKPMITADPETEIEKKRVENEKGLASDNESSKDKKKSKLKIKNHRKDSSHQLFSDSMHQELINSLDLTNVEPNDLSLDEEHVLRSPWKLTPKKSFPKRPKLNKKVVKNIDNDLVETTKRSVRQRQRPKEFWMPRNQYDLPNKATSVSEGKPENEELSKGNTNQNKASDAVFKSENEQMKTHLNQGNLKESFDIRNNSEKGDAVSVSEHPNINKVHIENSHVLKNVEEVNAECNKVITKNVEAKSKTKKLEFTQKFPNKTSDDENKSEKEDQVQGEGNNETKTKMDKVNLNSLATNFSDVFKQLNQLPAFEDCADGVQTAECWSLKNFKCGILKVSNQCQVSHKTSFENSYFGGVLIKGSLKMKIGSKDLEINQGDMAFVPPLTEWHVIGTHESESLFYYWCGRFKA